jgi:hypothetical protein
MVDKNSFAQVIGMKLRNLGNMTPFAERARRSVREIALAVILTLAAIVFGLLALGSPVSETASNDRPQPAVSHPN